MFRTATNAASTMLSGLLMLTMCSLPAARGERVEGRYFDLPSCDSHGLRAATEELGDPAVFAPDEQIEHVSTFINQTACVGTDDPNLPNALVQITNLTGREWTDLYYVGDPSTVFSNVDGFGDAGVFPNLTGLAFRIDSMGLNRPLIFESVAANDVFEPGETWQFIVQDYMSSIGSPDSFFSIGFADASVAVIETSAASVVQFVPEPSALWIIAVGLPLLVTSRIRRS